MYIIHNIYIYIYIYYILYYIIYNILLYNILLYNINYITIHIYIYVYWGLKQQFGLKCFARAQEWSHKANGNHIGFTSSTGEKPQLLHSITTTNTWGALRLPRRSLVLAPPVSCFQPLNRRVPRCRCQRGHFWQVHDGPGWPMNAYNTNAARSAVATV